MSTANDNCEHRDESDLKRYRTEIPNMADDDLDPYQYRLYAHYKRIGNCFESVRTTAKKTRMSAGQVVDTRNWLRDNGWIAVEDHPDLPTYRITVLDRWAENMNRYEAVHQVNDCSPGEHQRSPHEHQRSPGEPKKEPIKKEQRKKNIASRAGAKPKKPKEPSLSQHPAIQAFRRAAHLYPAKSWYQDVIDIVGDDVERWHDIVKEWVGLGNKPTNVKDMLDVFQNGWRSYQRRNGNGRRPSSASSTNNRSWSEADNFTPEQSESNDDPSLHQYTGDGRYPIDIWLTAIDELKLQMPRETFDKLLSRACLVYYEDGEVPLYQVQVHSQKAKEWIEGRLSKVIVRTLSGVAGREVGVKFELPEELRAEAAQ